jgi:non-specific serine/threonine protein kinase/serine/threonine-protein kinase
MSVYDSKSKWSGETSGETRPEIGTPTAGTFAGGEATIDTGTGSATPSTSTEKSKTIGPYSLLCILGEGGMGQVWLAEQTVPVNRRVALKLIKGGLYDTAVIQRFEAERQSLAVMNHPAIAKVFDAGSTADGQPYFVMEYVEGLPISRYCDSKKLQVRQRLELFIKVCEGVQHAHQKAIIHRDLKPSNILVTEVDGKPVPRIIDFGIAKAISTQPGADRTMFTQAGALIGTPGFMSPEQADPGVLDLDTRTDVYSLGIILYLLLTGTLPFDPQEWKKKPIDQVLRQLREEDSPTPSTKLDSDKNTAATSAESRGTDRRQLVSLLKGDLDWITMKAVEKDRARRYGSASELAADVDRFLSNRPVVARPASTGYRLKKYVQRHRASVAVASALALLLVVFAVAQAVQLRRITRERDRADRIAQFMTEMFKVSDPNEAKGNRITVREILDKASKQMDSSLARDPELRAKMMGTMGHVYLNLGLWKEARPLLENAIQVQRQSAAPMDAATLQSMSMLSFVMLREGRYSEAEKLLRETIEGQRRMFGPDNIATLDSTRTLASTLEFAGRYAEADKIQRDALARERKALGPEHWDTLLSMNVMANILDDEGRVQEAEKLYRETAEIQKRTLGAEHPDTLTSMSNLAGALEEEGRFAEAEKLQRETLEVRRRVLGPENPDTLAVLHNLANTLKASGQYAESEKLFRETGEIQRRVLGPENPDTLLTMHNLGSVLHVAGRNQEAEKLERVTLDARRRVLGPEHPDTVKTIYELAGTLSSENKFEEAKKLFEELVQIAGRAPDHSGLIDAWYNFACSAAIAGHHEEAFQYLNKAIQAGYGDADHITKDEDLKSLRGDPQFALLLEAAKQRATVAAAK